MQATPLIVGDVMINYYFRLYSRWDRLNVFINNELKLDKYVIVGSHDGRFGFIPVRFGLDFYPLNGPIASSGWFFLPEGTGLLQWPPVFVVRSRLDF